MTGPEEGTQFSDVDGNSVNGSYVNWESGEPNSSTMDYIIMYSQNATASLRGKWLDGIFDGEYTYLVEYGGMDGDPTIDWSITTTLDVVKPQSPVIDGKNDSPTYNTSEYNPVIVFPNFTVTDAENSNIKGLTIYFSSGYQSNQDTLLFSNTSKITGQFNKTNGELILSGEASPSEYQAAVRSITYVNNAPLFSSIDGSQRQLTISLVNADYLTSNGHFYQYVGTGVTWTEARDASAMTSYYGLQGYLATISSEEENQFVLSKIKDISWLGGSDENNETVWKWVTGPVSERTQFSTGSTPYGESYTKWRSGQPNNQNDQDYLAMDDESSTYPAGEWNDRPNSDSRHFIIEYGGMDGDPTINMTTTTTLNIDVVRPEAPGGIVDNLELWLNAEKGFTYTSPTDAEWMDQSRNKMALNVNLIRSPKSHTVAPTLANNSDNFNSIIAFDGVGTGLASAVNAADFDFSEMSVFSVQQVASGVYSHTVWHYNNDGYNDLAFFIDGSTTGNEFNITVNYSSLGNLTTPVLTDDIPHLVGFTSNASSAQIYVDAATVLNVGGRSQLAANGALMIGLDADGAEAQDGDNHLKGNIGEVIMFRKKLSDLDRQKVESYLALKYGISLNSNYVASDGTTSIWTDDSDGYNKDIFGIGRDNASGLNQKVSKSANAGTILTVALDADFTSANNDASRTTEHNNDLQFLTVANNGAALTPQFTEVNATSGFNVRLAREWKVDASNFTQNISLRFEGLDDEWTLYKDNDGDFSSGVTALGTLDANGEITNISLADGDYLTLGKRIDAPGGVFNNLSVWFNANSGTTNGGSQTTNGNITSWEGQIVQSTNITKVNNVAGDPAVVPNSANFNAVVSFDGNDAIRTTATAPYTSYFNSTTDNNTIFLVKKSTAGNVEAGFDANTSGADRAGYFERVGDFQRTDYGDNTTILVGNTTTINKYVIARQDVQSGDLAIYLDGALETQTATFNSLSGSSDGRLGFGAQPNTFTAPATVDIAEYIIYASDLSAAEIEEVESYLALKYGISKTGNFLASDGSTIWSTSDNTGYATDIFGIGRDDASGLNQKVSRSVNSSNSPVLSTSADFSSSNSDAGRTTLDDGSFMLMGHNNGAENSFTSSFNGGTNNRSDRVWKVDETGTVGDIYFAIPYAAATFPSGGSPAIVISNNDSFDDQDQVEMLTYDRANGIYYAKINPADGDYIALAISEISVTTTAFFRTESVTTTTGITSYPSYTDFINNTNGTYTAFSHHWSFADSFFADGVYFYRTNDVKTTVTRYPSLADLAAGTNGIVYNFTSGGNPKDWHDDDEFFASGNQFFRTASSTSLSKTVGVSSYPSFADLVANTNETYSAFTGTYNFEDQFFHDGEYFYRTNTNQVNKTQFGVARYESLSELVANNPLESPAFGPWSTNDDIFAVGITAGFTVSETALTINENAGTGTFTVVLDAQPANNVVFDVTSDKTDEATVDKATLTFTSANWNAPQTVTVTGVDDNVFRNDSATITVSVNDASSDNTFDVLADQTVGITLTDDEEAPTVSASPINPITYCSSEVSEPTSFDVSGANLYEDLVIAAPTGFEISLNSSSAFTDTISLTPSSNAVSSTTIYARVAAGQNGDLSGTITVSSGIANETVTVSAANNNALYFDGVDDYVSLSGNTIADGATSFTIETWILPDNSNWDGGFHAIIGYQEGADNTAGKRNPSFYIIDGKIHVDMYEDGTLTRYAITTDDAVVQKDVWTHLALVKDNTEYRFYVNGQLVLTKEAPEHINITGAYQIGYINNYFAGKIDDIRFWSTACTQTEIQNNMNVALNGDETGLVGDYTFNQGTADGSNGGVTTLYDSSPSGINGTLNNMALTGNSSNWVDGYFAQITGANTVNKAETLQLNHAQSGGIWSSDNAGIATVNQSGQVTGVSGGSVNINYELCSKTTFKSITVKDDAAYTVNKTTLTVAENAGTNTFTVVLDVKPTSDVVFDVSSNDTNEATVDKATLTFTTENWDTP